jgi:hypothetical protein
VDVSYKALTGSLTHYAARALYTEMEMFIPIEHALPAIQEWRCVHYYYLPNDSIHLFMIC